MRDGRRRVRLCGRWQEKAGVSWVIVWVEEEEEREGEGEGGGVGGVFYA